MQIFCRRSSREEGGRATPCSLPRSHTPHAVGSFSIEAKIEGASHPARLLRCTTNPATLRRWFARGYSLQCWRQDRDCFRQSSCHRYRRRVGCPSLPDIRGKTWPAAANTDFDYRQGEALLVLRSCADPVQHGEVGAGIDVKADGGYVVAPRAFHPTGKKYQWHDLRSRRRPRPEWLVHLARAAKPVPISRTRKSAGIRPATPPPGAYGRAALEREIADAGATAPGTRPQRCAQPRACGLAQLVAGGELERDEVFRRCSIEPPQTNGLAKTGWLAEPSGTIAAASVPACNTPRSRGGGMTELRPYQRRSGCRFQSRSVGRATARIILVAPTGSGKTVIAAEIIKTASRRFKDVLVLAHRREIISQTGAKLHERNMWHGIIQAGFHPRPLERGSGCVHSNLAPPRESKLRPWPAARRICCGSTMPSLPGADLPKDYRRLSRCDPAWTDRHAVPGRWARAWRDFRNHHRMHRKSRN